MNRYILNIYTSNDILYKILYRIKKIKNWILPSKKIVGKRDIKLIENNPYQKKGIQYITYNNLISQYSAFNTLTRGQKLFWVIFLGVILFLVIIKPITALTAIFGGLTFIYFIDFMFTILTITRSFGKKSEIKYTKEEIVEVDDATLPRYTILCPMYKEWQVIEQFTKAIEIIDWPKEKLEVILLLEEDDTKTINAVYDLKLPSYFKVEIVPNSLPKTKPKACNWGLIKTTGEYVVVYDAEDKPDPLQLKKAYLAFKKLPENVACLQSKLNYYNQNQNLLTKLFTAEYSYWFDIALPGLQSLDTIIPLGGTSNHFKTVVLKKLQGWDPFNVTEDCDLGTRLFKEGYKTAVIDSETLEEANSNLKSWIKQRSRWIKGYMQTYLVHMRNPFEFIKKYKHHALLFQLIIGMRMVFMVINPFMWLMTIGYFTMYPSVGPFIEALYPWYIFYPAVFCLIFANFTYFYSFMIASAKKDKWDLMQYIFLIPFYWILTSIAAVKAFYQLFANPYYWEKTAHGLHLSGKEKKGFKLPNISIEPSFKLPNFSFLNFSNKRLFSLKDSIQKNRMSGESVVYVNSDTNNIDSSTNIVEPKEKKISNKYNFQSWNGFANDTISFINRNIQKVTIGGGILIAANLFANFSNYLFSTVLGRNLSYEDFGSTSLITNLNLLLQVITGALFAAVSYKSAILLGKRGRIKKDLWRKVQKNAILIFLPISLLMVGVSYLINQSFDNTVMTFAVSLTLVLSALSAVNGGFLSGSLKFVYLAILVVLAPIIKFAAGYLGLIADNIVVIYFSQTIATFISLVVSWIFISRIKDEKTKSEINENTNFPKKFYITSVMNRFSVAFFLSADVILAKMFLSPVEAGKYAILSLIGKTIYFLGSLIPQFITPVIGKEVGEGKDGLRTFYKIFPLTVMVTVSAFIIFGIYPQYFAIKLFGDKVQQILQYAYPYSFAIAAFTIAQSIATYHQTRKQYIFSYLGFILSFFEIIYLVFFHDSIGAIVHSIYTVAFSYFIAVIIMHYAVIRKTAVIVNLASFFKLFSNVSISESKKDKANILILNWRDTKHRWKGGAEVYIQEIAERWVRKGYGVTIFCGNDGESKYDEKVKGVNIIRRGGFFTLYVWAAVYYLIRLRKHFDFIVDCENGIPFFSPLYSSKPKVLLIHHVHQTVFRENLPKPLALIAMFLESNLMKKVYKKIKIVTVSKSSQENIEALKISDQENIDIVNPGINIGSFVRMKKYEVPTFSYLGRLMPYKNIDILLKAFENVLGSIPNAKLVVAGRGPDMENLKKLANRLNIRHSVDFRGYVDEHEKRKVLSRSWILVQPSSFEGWGITVTEANASGTPVIASNTSGLKDSVLDGQTGLLVKTGSIEEMSRAMTALTEMEGFRERISRNAYEWSQNFSWTDSAEKFLNIIIRETEKTQKLNIPTYVYSR